MCLRLNRTSILPLAREAHESRLRNLQQLVIRERPCIGVIKPEVLGEHEVYAGLLLCCILRLQGLIPEVDREDRAA